MFFLPYDLYIPDIEARVMPDGKLYLYGSLDRYPDKYCCKEHVVVSTSDMKTWEISPVCFSVNDVPWADKNDPELMLYAPDAIYRNGKYYLYFCLSDGSEGVAVSDSPAGPFKDAVRLPVEGIDPSVFIDDDGQAYYYWAQHNAHGAKLNPDMMSIDLSSVKDSLLLEEVQHFHEGSSMRKINGTYYYVYADISRGRSTCLGYSTGKSPLGPFTYRGVIVDNIPLYEKSWNNHGSLVEFKGKWYVFFHVSTCNNYLRRSCAAEIEFLPDGSIKEVVL